MLGSCQFCSEVVIPESRFHTLQYVLISVLRSMQREKMMNLEKPGARELLLMRYVSHSVATRARERVLESMYKRRINNDTKHFLQRFGYVECCLVTLLSRTLEIRINHLECVRAVQSNAFQWRECVLSNKTTKVIVGRFKFVLVPERKKGKEFWLHSKGRMSGQHCGGRKLGCLRDAKKRSVQWDAK